MCVGFKINSSVLVPGDAVRCQPVQQCGFCIYCIISKKKNPDLMLRG